MARFSRIDSQICTNRLILLNRFRVPELNPFVANRAVGGLKNVNCRFEAIRANRSHVMEIVFFFFLRVDSRESVRRNCPDSHREPPGHLSSAHS